MGRIPYLFSVMRSLAFAGALVASHAPTGAAGKATPSFEPGPCPKTPEPMEELKTARCGTLIVPENRAHDTGRTIRLAVAILPAKAAAKKPEPIVFMSGGPGASSFMEIPFVAAAGVNRD